MLWLNRRRPMKHKRLILLPLLLGAVTAWADNSRPPLGDSPWRTSAQGAIVVQPDSSLDTGGDMQVTRSFMEGGISRAWSSGWRSKLSVGYGEDDYDFSGSAGFGGSDPWGRVRELRLSAFMQYAFDDRWTLFGIPSLRYNAESGASLSDGRTAGLLAGAGYRVSDRLTIGPGLGVFSELEDDTSIFPILIIDWQITDRLSLETGRGFAASRGPGLRLRWAYSPRWQFALGARYEKFRFRLDDQDSAPGGVGEEKAVPLYAMAEYSFSPDVKLSLFGGSKVGASLRLENASGQRLRESDLSNAPFFGASVRANF